MKNFKKWMVSIFVYAFLVSFIGALPLAAQKSTPVLSEQSTGKIYLYGEQHGIEKILEKEIEIWGDYYTHKGLRHLFLETPYYTAQFLNIWMKSDVDELLNKVYNDWKGTANYTPVVKDFYKEIKTRFPETVFHGTDVGHQYESTGKQYLDYLSQQNKENTEEYTYAKEIIAQGKYYYNKRDGAYRENKMAANFVREFNKLANESIMGIYGGAHTGISSKDRSNSVPSMANQLHKIYADQLFTKNLAQVAKDINSLRCDTIRINDSDYKALYFGKQSLKGFKDFEYREFWRLEGAFSAFEKALKTGDVLPYNNYPMKIAKGQVFVIDYMKTDGTLTRKYYKSDGKVWNNRASTEEFIAQ